MDAANHLPDDLAQCQRLLLAAYKQSVVLEVEAKDATQQAAELRRVLDETAASYEALQQEHAIKLDELAKLKRWAFGRRRERFTEGKGQGHLFELDTPEVNNSEEPAPNQEDATEVKGHRRRKNRKIDWDKLPQIRHDHDLPEEERECSCCGRLMDCIGEDVTRELEFEPAKLEAHIHVRPK